MIKNNPILFTGLVVAATALLLVLAARRASEAGAEAVVSAFGGIEGIPTTFIIDCAGNIVGEHVGYGPRVEFEADIRPLL